MTRMIFCTKLKKEAAALDEPPYPTDLGEKIFSEISAEAWEMWLARQIMFINEYRLDLSEPKDRKFLMSEMKKFLFENQDNKPEGFIET